MMQASPASHWMPAMPPHISPVLARRFPGGADALAEAAGAVTHLPIASGWVALISQERPVAQAMPATPPHGFPRPAPGVLGDTTDVPDADALGPAVVVVMGVEVEDVAVLPALVEDAVADVVLVGEVAAVAVEVASAFSAEV